MRRWKVRIAAAGSALVASIMPAVAAAQEPGSRAVDVPADATTAILAAAGGVTALFLIWTLGRLYQKQRGLRWRFQEPDQVDDHGGAH